MSVQQPCSVCEKFENGRVRTTYITFYVEEESVTYRLKACKTCTGDARHLWLEYGDLKREDGTWLSGNSNVPELMEAKALAEMAQPTSARNAAQRRHSSSPQAGNGSTSVQSTA